MGQQLPARFQVEEGRISFLLPGEKESSSGHVGDVCGGWIIRWVQDAAGQRQAVLEQTHDEGGSWIIWSEKEGTTIVQKPRPGAHANPPDSALYLGHTLDDVLSSARDLLGEAVLRQGEPSYEAVVGALPPVQVLRYQILGGPQSRGKYVMLRDGTICTRERHMPTLIFSPAWIDGRTAEGQVYDGLVDDWMPAACYRIVTADARYDLVALVEYDDSRQEPALWVALSRYRATDHSPETSWYLRFSPEETKNWPWLQPTVCAEDFYRALTAFVRSWQSFSGQQCPVDLPEDRISRWVRGSLALAATTFEGDHPKYGGGRNYNRSRHDTFPPALHDTAEAFMLWGDVSRAKRYLDYGLRYIVRPDGTFNYYGASASEYGRWLWLLERAERQLDDPCWLATYVDKLVATGMYLESLRKPVLGADHRLIYLGAEADNRDWVHVYFSNNLWAYRGLKALGQILERQRLFETGQDIDQKAESLWRDAKAVMQATAVETDYGPLLPSHVGYPAPPWTLSIGPPVPEEVSSAEGAAYLADSETEPRFADGQDHFPRQCIRENTYANYRYYLEALSSGLLEPSYANALAQIRRERGGEILGMSRIFQGIDDWPVANYARYLLSTDQIDRYLLLYYAHMAHHGNRETLTYYEWISVDGKVVTTDVVPCVLTVPLMTAWMLCFEPVGEEAIYLYRGVPSAWLQEGKRVSFERLGTSVGPVTGTVSVLPQRVEVLLRLPQGAAARQVYLDLRIGDRGELAIPSNRRGEVMGIQRIHRGYRLQLRRGLTGQVDLCLC